MDSESTKSAIASEEVILEPFEASPGFIIAFLLKDGVRLGLRRDETGTASVSEFPAHLNAVGEGEQDVFDAGVLGQFLVQGV